MRSKLASGTKIALILNLLHAAPAYAQYPSLAGVPLTPDGFTAAVTRMINNAGIPQPVRITAPLTLKARRADGTEAQIFLDRVYSACRNDPANCQTFLQREITGVSDGLRETPEPARLDTLRVVVRPADFLNEPQIGKTLIPVTPSTMPAGLVALLYVDLPRSMRTLTKHDLEGLHLSLAQAYRVALENTKAELQSFDEAVHTLPPDQPEIVRDSSYESSRILMHKDWQKIAKQFHYHLLIAIPSAEELIYTEGRSEGSLATFSKIAHDRYLKAERRISPSVYQYYPNHWVIVAQ